MQLVIFRGEFHICVKRTKSFSLREPLVLFLIHLCLYIGICKWLLLFKSHVYIKAFEAKS